MKETKQLSLAINEVGRLHVNISLTGLTSFCKAWMKSDLIIISFSMASGSTSTVEDALLQTKKQTKLPQRRARNQIIKALKFEYKENEIIPITKHSPVFATATTTNPDKSWKIF